MESKRKRPLEKHQISPGETEAGFDSEFGSGRRGRDVPTYGRERATDRHQGRALFDDRADIDISGSVGLLWMN